MVEAAVAMHTEVALRPRIKVNTSVATRHLGLAASIVDVGEPSKMKRLGFVPLERSMFEPIAPPFRRLWYITAITALQRAGGAVGSGPSPDAYLVNARALFPADADILLLSGITEEMRGSGRVGLTGASVRKEALRHAEGYLRESLTLAPDRMETRLRLGRVLQERGDVAAARDLLTTVSAVEDARLSYLASLFLGGLEDATGDVAAAATWYARAAAKLPSAQVARLAGNELLHRTGARRQAAEALPAGIGASNTADPWWGYLFGEYWRRDLLLDALRRMARS
jgi:tetratricopeptide (TPR) repeat protein